VLCAVVATAALLAAGISHLRLAPQHWTHSHAHGLVLAMAGIVELLWVAAFTIRRSQGWTGAGFVLATGLFCLWCLSLVFGVPTEMEADPPDVLAVATNGFELGGVLALAGYLTLRYPRRARAYATVWLISALLGAGALYGTAQLGDVALRASAAPAPNHGPTHYP
jgi:hypothetical protein